MITTETVISFIIGAIITIVYKLVKFEREFRRRLENYEKSNEISRLILEVIDCPPKVDYLTFFRKETMIYKKMMELPTDIWKSLTFEERKDLIQSLSDVYDRMQNEINNKDQEN